MTCAKILASVFASLGKSVQAFGDYAGERSGAPVRAYARVADGPITNRNKVYDPDHLVVLDPGLLGEGTVAGLARGGTLLVNTAEPAQTYDGRFERHRLATVDASAIARRHGIGTRSLVIVNTAMAGAFARVFDLPFDALAQTYRKLGLEGDVPAAQEAYDAVVVREASVGAAGDDGDGAGAAAAGGAWGAGGAGQVSPVVENLEGAPTGIKTGGWRTQTPLYVQAPAPCSVACPAGNDVVGFLQALDRHDEVAAAAVLAESNPLAGTCGRVCPAPCMGACNRGALDGAVNIRSLERWIADHAPVARPGPQRVGADGHAVAVVGGGPAGLGAAYEIARAGHRATIIEGDDQLGGLLRTGIPVYRLDREVLDREIAGIVELGVQVRSGAFVDRAGVQALAGEFDGVIVATGLQRSRELDAPGVDLPGVEQGIAYLRRLNLRGPGEAGLEGHVVVLGGGNTAMDCARSALRSGARQVTVAYRRTRLEMPAIVEEVEEAEEEGVRFLFQRQPVAFDGTDRVGAVELAEVDMGPPDESGRRRPVVSERTQTVACDAVLLALGQSADLGLLPEGVELRQGRAHREGEPLNIFAAGDVATGDGTVTHAIGDGRRAATRALGALTARAAPEDAGRASQQAAATSPVTAEDIRRSHFEHVPPAADRRSAGLQRARHYGEVNHGLADPGEAARCFSCGDCTGCDICLVYCPDGIIHRTGLAADSGAAYVVDADYCKGCGICAAECPRGALIMVAS